MENGANIPARVATLEAQVEELAILLGGTMTALGILNAHVALTASERDPAKLRERLDEIQAEIQNLYERLEATWPEED
jgi:hypothetical protein